MSLVDYVIVALVAIAVVVGVRRAIGVATGRRDCCSGDAKGGAKSFGHTKIADTNEANYPYSVDLTILDMTCENCVKCVTDALNSIEGTWARVDLKTRSAHVLSKTPIDESAYRKVVSDAGYRAV